MQKKYPWEKLKKVGDSFIADAVNYSISANASTRAKKNGWKIKCKKVPGGTLITRVA